MRRKDSKVNKAGTSELPPSLIIIYLFSSNQAIDLMSKVFTNGPGDRGSIPGWVIPKTQKMVLDAEHLAL